MVRNNITFGRVLRVLTILVGVGPRAIVGHLTEVLRRGGRTRNGVTAFKPTCQVQLGAPARAKRTKRFLSLARTHRTRAGLFVIGHSLPRCPTHIFHTRSRKPNAQNSIDLRHSRATGRRGDLRHFELDCDPDRNRKQPLDGVPLRCLQPVEVNWEPFAHQHRHSFGQRQTNHVGVGPHYFLYKATGQALDGIASRFATPLP